MRNELLPTHKAVYQPLPTPFQLSHEKANASLAESQLESAQAALDLQQARDALSKELGPLQLLSLRRKLEATPPVVFSRQTTTKFKPSASANGEPHLPKPALGIQGSISTTDIVSFLREHGAFDLETDYSEGGKPVHLNRLTLAQINTACEFSLVSESSSSQHGSESIDKLGRIKKTGRYALVAHILPSNIRARIPVIVRPNLASTSSATSASTPASASTSTSASVSSMSGQTRGYATSSKPTSMESAMRTKLEAEFGPQVQVHIRNDSSKHAHHAAMAAQGGGNGETHFYVHVVSDKFQGMTQIKRHRAVNALLQSEFDRGLHALSLRTKTWAEEAKLKPELDAASNQESTVEDPTRCAQTPSATSARESSLWTAPQSQLYPTSPLAHAPASTTTQATDDILSAFYTRPPTTPTIAPNARSVTRHQREKFFRRVTRDEAVEPSAQQNRLNVLGGILATACAAYMVLVADFGQPEGSTNCFTDLRKWVWGEQGPPQLNVF